MLKILRKKGVSKKILWVIAFIIIVSFTLFGTTARLDKSSAAGQIFGKKVSFDQYENIYQQVSIQAMLQYGENFEKVKNFINLENETWNRLILLAQANRKHIKVRDNEIISKIQSFEFFKRDNVFDTALYQTILNHVFRVKPRNFEESVRDSLKIEKLLNSEIKTIDVPEQEIKDFYKTQNEKIQVSYVLITPEKFTKEASYTEEEALNYFKNNQAEFLQPPTIKAAYIYLPFPEKPEAKEKEEPTASSEKNAVKDHAYEIYQELLKTPNLTQAAEKYNEKINESDYFTMENPPLTFGWSYDLLNSLFNSDKATVAEPFETEKGIYLIQLKDKKASFVPEYSVVKDKVRDAVLLVKAQQIARAKADEYLNVLKEEMDKTKLKDFGDAAKTIGLEVKQTPLFNRDQYLPQIGISKSFQEAAFELTEANKMSSVVKTGIGYCILHLDHYEPIDEKEFAKQKEEIRKQLVQTKQNEAITQYLTELRTAANLENNLEKLKSRMK